MSDCVERIRVCLEPQRIRAEDDHVISEVQWSIQLHQQGNIRIWPQSENVWLFGRA